MNDYIGQLGYHTNAYEYNEFGGDPVQAILKMVLGGFAFPYKKQEYAPLGMSQRDFDLIRYNSEIAKVFRGKHKNFNPMAIGAASHLLQGMGVENANKMFIDNTGNVTQLGTMISMTADKLLGVDSNPWASLGNAKASFWAQMKGLNFGREATGLAPAQINTVVDQLMYGTYVDASMSQTRGLWNQNDIMSIAAIGRDYNLYKGVGVGDIAKKTHDLGRTIQSSMNTFGVSNKEEALRAIIEVTGGDIDITDTSKYQNMLNRIKSIGESANLSAQVLKAVLDRGTEIGKLLGNTGVTSTNLNLAAIDTIRLSNNKLSFPIGTQQLQRMMSDELQQIAASDASSRLGSLLVTGGKDYEEYLTNTYINTGRKMTAEDYNRIKGELINKRVKDQNISMYQASQDIELELRRNKYKGAEIISEKNPEYYSRMSIQADFRYLADTAINPEQRKIFERLATPDLYKKQALETLQKEFNDKTIVDPDIEETADVLRKRDLSSVEAATIDYISKVYQEYNPGTNEKEAIAFAENNFQNYVNQRQISADKKRSQLADNKRFIEETAKEYTRKQSSGLSDALRSYMSGESILTAVEAAFPTPDLGYAQNTKNVREFSRFLISDPEAREKMYWGMALMGGRLSEPGQVQNLLDISYNDIQENKDYTKQLKTLLGSGAEITPNAINEELLKQNINLSTMELLRVTKAYNPKHLKDLFDKRPNFAELRLGMSWDDFIKSDTYTRIIEEHNNSQDFANREEFKKFTEDIGRYDLFLSTVGSPEERQKYLEEQESGISRAITQSELFDKRRKVEQSLSLKRTLLFNPDSITNIKVKMDVPKEATKKANKLIQDKMDSIQLRAKAYNLPSAIREVLADSSDVSQYTMDPVQFANMYKSLDLSKIDTSKFEEVSLDRPSDAVAYDKLKEKLRGFKDETILSLLDVDKSKITKDKTADILRLEKMQTMPEFKGMTDEQRKQALYFAQDYRNEQLFKMGVGTDKNKELFSIDKKLDSLEVIKQLLMSWS